MLVARVVQERIKTGLHDGETEASACESCQARQGQAPR